MVFARSGGPAREVLTSLDTNHRVFFFQITTPSQKTAKGKEIAKATDRPLFLTRCPSPQIKSCFLWRDLTLTYIYIFFLPV